MSRTVWILIIIGVIVWAYCIKKGSERGLIQELNTVLTLICAAAPTKTNSRPASKNWGPAGCETTLYFGRSAIQLRSSEEEYLRGRELLLLR